MKTVLYKAFYIVKPLVPRKLQIFLRTILIRKAVVRYREVWPILESAARKKPADWKGWPENKQFALILTHDVEHQKGYDKVIDLMQLEKDIKFVSSFNFVPERDYKVEKTVLNILTNNGFEVGVQGLYHDGRLYSSRKEFLRRAAKINEYLKEWDSVGFRSPAMHHNLEWLLDLNIKYDLSTFDTDPFEPQSDGMETIFPFRVNGKANRGYLELPYTLPQDSTLFIIMKEKDNSIWKNKLEWIIKNKGMALVNVHPDYINFEGKKTKEEEYPVSFYMDLLEYVKNNYEGSYWNVTPKELTAYLAGQKAFIEY